MSANQTLLPEDRDTLDAHLYQINGLLSALAHLHHALDALSKDDPLVNAILSVTESAQQACTVAMDATVKIYIASEERANA